MSRPLQPCISPCLLAVRARMRGLSRCSASAILAPNGVPENLRLHKERDCHIARRFAPWMRRLLLRMPAHGHPRPRAKYQYNFSAAARGSH